MFLLLLFFLGLQAVRHARIMRWCGLEQRQCGTDPPSLQSCRYLTSMPSYIIFTWGIGDTYHPLTLNIPLNVFGLLNSQYSAGFVGVICSCPEQEVAWRGHPSLLPQDNRWVSCTDLFHIHRCNYFLRCLFYLVLFITFGKLSSCKEILVVFVFVGWEGG